MILFLSQSDQTTISQYVSARMIGFIADILRDKIKGPLLEIIRGFCTVQDEDIRCIVATEVLLKICNNISVEMM